MNILRQLLDENSLNWNDLYYYREDIEMIIEAEKKIAKNSEIFTQKLDYELRQKVKQDIQLTGNPSNEEEEQYEHQYYEHYYGRIDRGIKLILQNQRKASVLSIFTIIEGQLKILCDLIKIEFTLAKPNKRTADYIQHYLTYLEERYELNISSLETTYNEIKNQKIVKNIIAHDNSIVKTSKIEIINSIEGLSVLTHSSELNISGDNYVLNLLENVEVFFKELLKLIDNRYKEVKLVV